MIYIGLDDTDTLESRGTGRLARQIAAHLSEKYPVLGVTRHQLLVDPRVPYTKNNSSAAIHLDGSAEIDLTDLFEQVRLLMLSDFQEGSDPGLCIVAAVPMALKEFGQRAKREVLTQAEAQRLAQEHQVFLSGLGGTNAGMIGALAALGLASSGEDGRFIQIGHIRELSGLVNVQTALAAGIASVKTMENVPVSSGLMQVEKLRPALRGGQAIQYVDQPGEYWLPVKLD
jgi:tRNA(Ile2) C34 agmatinyltransferase TiaS